MASRARSSRRFASSLARLIPVLQHEERQPLRFACHPTGAGDPYGSLTSGRCAGSVSGTGFDRSSEEKGLNMTETLQSGTGLDEALGALAAGFRGQLLRAGDEGYDQARILWNGMIDRRPAVIAQCAG